MARSLRSKHGRKLRAFKRIRYGEKELLRLKNMLAVAAEEEKQSLPENSVALVPEFPPKDVPMDENLETPENQLPTKPSKYPSWLSHFKIKKLAKQERKKKHKEAKRLKKEKKKMSRRNKKK